MALNHKIYFQKVDWQVHGLERYFTFDISVNLHQNWKSPMRRLKYWVCGECKCYDFIEYLNRGLHKTSVFMGYTGFLRNLLEYLLDIVVTRGALHFWEKLKLYLLLCILIWPLINYTFLVNYCLGWKELFCWISVSFVFCPLTRLRFL